VADPILPPELNPRGTGRPFPTAPKPPKGAPAGASGAAGGPGDAGAGGGWRRPLGITAIVLAVVVLAASGIVYTRYLHYNHNLTRATGVIKPGGAVASGGAQNVLLVGSDSRSGAGDAFAQAPKGQEQVIGQRSDTVILAHIAKGNKKATLVSLPRDSWVTIPAYTDPKGVAHPAHEDKLNAAFSLGGPALLVSTVQQLTGIHIDHYAEIDFAGFQNMVNALGGVDVCLTKAAHDVNTGINLSAGQHHLNGTEALAFVRQRYGLALGDIDRIKRQQQFLASMLRKVESTGTLANPLKLNAFLDALTKSITVDSGMSTGDMTKLALKLKGLSSGNVILTTMPISGFTKKNGQDVDVVDQAKASALFGSFAHDGAPSASASGSASAAPTVPAGSVHVRVFNGAGVSGLAGKAASDLKKLGFVVDGTPGNRGTGATSSVIEYGPTQSAAANTLAAAVPGSTLKANPQLGTDLELVVGSSYTGAGAPAPAASGAVDAGGTTAADATCTA
jgi:LCP family protein required for cell wall assembly